MNLRALTRKYLGWCPGMEAASGFQSRTILQSLSLPFFGIASTLVILIVGTLMFTPLLIYATRYIRSDFYSGNIRTELILSGFSILIMLASLVLTNRWFRPLDYKNLKINMKNLIILGFATNALSLIWINSYNLVLLAPRDPFWILPRYPSRIMRVLIPMLKTATGFILLKLTSNIVHEPVMNEENTKLVSLVLGGMSLTGLTSALQGIIDPGPYPPEFWMSVVLPMTTLIIPCAAIGLLAYDIFMHKRVRERIGLAVLYLGLASVLYENIYWIIRGIEQGYEIQILLLVLYSGGSTLTNTLIIPGPTLPAVVAVIFGIVLHRAGLGTSRRLKAIYSFAIIYCALANIYVARTFPIYLGHYLKDIETLISIGSFNLAPWIPNAYVWLYLTRIFDGFIILAFGILCLAQPRIDFKMETLYRLEPRRRFDLARISRLVLAVLGAIAILSLLFFVAPYFSPKLVEWKEQYQSPSHPEIYTPLILTYNAPADWIQVAQHSDPAGDHIAPNIMKHGVAVGGTDHIGADILNVTLHSSYLSDELTIVVCLNGKGRDDPTIDPDRTKLKVSFDGIRAEGRASIYYNGEGDGHCQDRWSRLPGDFAYDWTNPCRLKLYFKKLPLIDIINNIGIATKREYKEGDSSSSIYIHQVIDYLTIDSFGLSRGITLTSLDFSKHNSPLYGSSMAGMDIVKVDVYRGGNYLNVTVRLSDEGWFDYTISDARARSVPGFSLVLEGGSDEEEFVEIVVLQPTSAPVVLGHRKVVWIVDNLENLSLVYFKVREWPTLTLTVSQTEVVEGDTVDIEGGLFLEGESCDGQEIDIAVNDMMIGTVKTAEEGGGFSFTYTFVDAGSYEVKSSCEYYEKTIESPIATVTVKSPPLLSSELVAPITGIAIAVAVAGYMLMKRR